jgi:beta-phosphoglucomutase-like phosphatase (HAD superfamily)
LAIASNSYIPWVEEYAKRAGVWDYFACVRTLGDVEHGKPAPDLYRSAAACLNIPAAQCIAVEDSPTGMRAALSAGMRVVAVLNKMTAPLARPEDVSLTLNALSELSPDALLAHFHRQ